MTSHLKTPRCQGRGDHQGRPRRQLPWVAWHHCAGCRRMVVSRFRARGCSRISRPGCSVRPILDAPFLSIGSGRQALAPPCQSLEKQVPGALKGREDKARGKRRRSAALGLHKKRELGPDGAEGDPGPGFILASPPPLTSPCVHIRDLVNCVLSWRFFRAGLSPRDLVR